MFNERNTSVTFTFGNNKVELTNDEFLDAYADNQYVTICSKENGVYEATGAIDYKNSYDSDKKDNDNSSDDSCNDEDEIDTTDKESEESESEEAAEEEKLDNDKENSNKVDSVENESKDESTPKTGDFNFLNEIAIIGAVALAIAVVILRKRAMN